MDGLNVANNAKIIYLHMVYLNNRLRPTEQLAQKVSDVLTALQQITKLSHDQYYGPVRALENRKLQISLGKIYFSLAFYIFYYQAWLRYLLNCLFWTSIYSVSNLLLMRNAANFVVPSEMLL